MPQSLSPVALNLRAQPLSVTRAQREQLHGHAGRVLWLTGLSGAGKSTIANALAAAVQFWKYGPPTAAVGGVAAASTWFKLGSATLSADRLTVTCTIADNGVGDSDATPGNISDPFALATGPVGGGAVSILVDAPWALDLLSAVLGFLGWRRQRVLSSG